MSIKEQIIQELEQISESTQQKLLDYLRHLKTEEKQHSENKAWQAYLESEQEREEVYRRLADS
ncbi:MAG: DUF2281 domain-containing protein [Cyanobacteria bacterium P01_C01_bin.38]